MVGADLSNLVDDADLDIYAHPQRRYGAQQHDVHHEPGQSVSTFIPAPVLAQFDTNLALITGVSSAGGVLHPSGYRFPLDKEPDSALDGCYFLDVEGVDPHMRVYGTRENITAARVTINVAYYRGGGDAAGGDRESVLRNAGDDAMHIADVCDLPANFNSSVSGIREIRYEGSRRVLDMPRGEIWRSTFWTQWRSDVMAS